MYHVRRADREELGMIMPGETAIASWQLDPGEDPLKLIAIFFRDAIGVRWLRIPGGEVEEVPNRPSDSSLAAIAQAGNPPGSR